MEELEVGAEQLVIEATDFGIRRADKTFEIPRPDATDARLGRRRRWQAEIGGGASWFGKPAVVTAAVLAIAFAKVWMVMLTFMEVRTAPIALKVLATVWLIAVLGVLLAIYAGVFA